MLSALSAGFDTTAGCQSVTGIHDGISQSESGQRSPTVSDSYVDFVKHLPEQSGTLTTRLIAAETLVVKTCGWCSATILGLAGSHSLP